MTLKEFQALRGLSVTELADHLGFSKGYTSMLLNGKRGFSTATGLQIRARTKGKVTLDDLVPTPKRRGRAA